MYTKLRINSRSFSFCLIVLVAAFSVPFTSAQGDQKPLFQSSFIWRYFEGGYLRNHVHGLTLTTKGTVLAFSEGRIGPHDGDPVNLIMKRSTDLGVTWSSETLIERTDGRFYEREGIEGKREAWTNPATLVDKRTGRIFFFYALNEGSHQQNWTRVFYRYSDDDGLTWQPKLRDKAIEITDLLKDNKNGWTFFMTGPGHGIQLEHQKGANAKKNGRLILQMWNRKAVNIRPRDYGVVLIYSDDGGKTWKRGAETQKFYGENESRIVEFGDGRVLLNSRGSEAEDNSKRIDARRSRIFAFSSDGGETFADPILRPELNYTNIDSGLNRYVTRDGKECFIFTHPDDPARRIKMTASLSCDGLQTWSYHKLIDEGRAAYSDVVILPDNTIGVLYGSQQNTDGPASFLPNGVKFVRFNYEWLTSKE